MKLKWNGHACFTLTLNDGRRIVTDPFDESVGYAPPMENADFVTVSHAHHDHNCLSALQSAGVVLDKAGLYEFEGLKIELLPSFHDDVQGKKRGNNLLAKITADGKTIVHLGDLGHEPDELQTAFMKNADVLLIPIGGTYTITSEQAAEIIAGVNPVCAVPMHYLTPAMSFPITDEKAFAASLNAKYLMKNEEDLENLTGVVIFNY